MEDVNRTASNSPSHGYIKVKSHAESNEIDSPEKIKSEGADRLPTENIQDDEDSAGEVLV